MTLLSNTFRSSCLVFGMAILASGSAAHAADPVHLVFETHAAFFSSETHQAKAVDPQVFVKQAGAAAGVGPQGIAHVAGFRPALIAADPGTSILFNANGDPLGFVLSEWLAARGTATLTPASGGAVTIKAEFHGLRPHAQYSLFENHFDQSPIGFTPLDGKGTSNTFMTDDKGDAGITVTAPQALTHANAVLVVLDEDGKTHGMSRGEIGINAAHHIISRVPG